MGQFIERVRQVSRDRGRMREQSNAPANERRAQDRLGYKSINAKFHGHSDFIQLQARRNRNDGNPPCPVDELTPNTIGGR